MEEPAPPEGATSPSVAEEVTDIIDFSIASPWEGLIQTLEEALRRWKVLSSDEAVAGAERPSADATRLCLREDFRWSQQAYTLRYCFPIPPAGTAAAGQQSGDGVEAAFATDQFERCFGVDKFISLETTDRQPVDANEAQLLLSSLTIATTNSGAFQLPLMVQAPGLQPPGEGGLHWQGLYRRGGDAGAGAGCSMPLLTRYETFILQTIPPSLSNLQGLTETFATRLVGPAGDDGFAGGGGSSLHSGMPRGGEGGGIVDLTASARLSYEMPPLEQGGQWWLAAGGGGGGGGVAAGNCLSLQT